MKHVKGDILTVNDGDAVVIVCHQVNCIGVMGDGLAKQIKAEYPGVYRVYKEKCEAADSKAGLLGDVQYCSVLSDAGYIIANVFGQEGYGRDGRCYTDYNALRKAFSDIAEAFPKDIIRIPYMMGCGLGGGDWGTVQAIIQETLCDKGVDVEIWEYNPAKKEEK